MSTYQSGPDLQQQQVIFACLNRSKHDEGWSPRGCQPIVIVAVEVGSERGGNHCRGLYPIAVRKRAKAVERSLAISDNSNRARQHIADPLDMAIGFACAAIFRVRDRDEVVNHVHRTNVVCARPVEVGWFVQCGMTDIEVGSTVAWETRIGAQPFAPEEARKLPPHAGACVQQQFEQAIRSGFRKNPPKAPPLDYRLRITAMTLEISKADAIDTGRQSTNPATPDEARDV